ncbi:MAG: hypothetical protein HYZ31_00475, partial [Gammaproteobacteria bacterium]|nr:hypothetical protein [Gammaproteobacteria bacterium]
MSTDEQLDLPWYVNNSLDENQRKAIAIKLSADAELNREAELLQHIRQQIKSSATPSPGELGCQRSKNQMQQTQQSKHQ